MLFDGTLPTNKKLFAGTLLAINKLFAGTLPANKKLFAGTPLVNKKLFALALNVLFYLLLQFPCHRQAYRFSIFSPLLL